MSASFMLASGTWSLVTMVSTLRTTIRTKRHLPVKFTIVGLYRSFSTDTGISDKMADHASQQTQPLRSVGNRRIRLVESQSATR